MFDEEDPEHELLSLLSCTLERDEVTQGPFLELGWASYRLRLTKIMNLFFDKLLTQPKRKKSKVSFEPDATNASEVIIVRNSTKMKAS